MQATSFDRGHVALGDCDSTGRSHRAFLGVRKGAEVRVDIDLQTDRIKIKVAMRTRRRERAGKGEERVGTGGKLMRPLMRKPGRVGYTGSSHSFNPAEPQIVFRTPPAHQSVFL